MIVCDSHGVLMQVGGCWHLSIRFECQYTQAPSVSRVYLLGRERKKSKGKEESGYTLQSDSA